MLQWAKGEATMVNEAERNRADGLFAEYVSRRRAGETPVTVISAMRDLSIDMPRSEQQILINLIREWERGQGTLNITSTLRAAGVDAPPTTAISSMTPSFSYVGSGSAQFSSSSVLYFHVAGQERPIMVLPKNETLLGIGGNNGALTPDIDLSEVGGTAYGVQALHCVLRRQSDALWIESIGPTTPVRVNGILLLPHKPVMLRDGDRVELQRLQLIVQFKNTIRRVGAGT